MRNRYLMVVTRAMALRVVIMFAALPAHPPAGLEPAQAQAHIAELEQTGGTTDPDALRIFGLHAPGD